MNKIFTLGVLAALASGAAAQTAPNAFQVTKGNLWAETGGMMALGVSANGRYICGACTNWNGFIYDTETEAFISTGDIEESQQTEQGAVQFQAVTDDGYAYGWDAAGCIRVGIDGSYKVFYPESEYQYTTPRGVTPDGSIVVGFVNPNFTQSFPCYWDADGTIHMLDYSTSEEAGFKINGASALAVSSDGRVIMGCLNSRSNRNPLVYWLRRDDGTYEYVPAFKDQYEDDRTVDGSYKTVYDNYLPKLLTPDAMSADGKTVAVRVIRVIEVDGVMTLGEEEVALFDIETNKISTVIEYDHSNLLYHEQVYSITGLSNSGIITGFSGDPYTGCNPFVIFPEDYNDAKTLNEAFPNVDLLDEYQAYYEDYNTLYMITAFSGDASTMVGYIEYDVDLPYSTSSYGFATFYVNTGYKEELGESGVETVIETGKQEAPVYYDLQGRKVANPDRGLYIRKEGSKATKVML